MLAIEYIDMSDQKVEMIPYAIASEMQARYIGEIRDLRGNLQYSERRKDQLYNELRLEGKKAGDSKSWLGLSLLINTILCFGIAIFAGSVGLPMIARIGFGVIFSVMGCMALSCMLKNIGSR